ncbi:GTP-binding protein Rheb isoform X5 [Myotis myotis]|uniref:GTP-binding protein Rheb isoform X5 n=1 Tax=Myotis myotis TaxID=51298 RepID=UPI00174B2A62|nr:GTP-binding protein Rheb isoform X5 [Myotis myotis]XP_059567422.1 GTP-binding protein Rheb isoform X5 [Myotis daubentonii]
MPLCPGAAAADRSTGVAAAAVHVVGLGLRRPPRCRSPSPGRSRSWATGLWDEYSIFPQTYSIDINGYILVYSVTSIKSFEVIKVIHGKLLDMVGKVQIPIMLVGNKKDLHMERVISYEEGKALAESWNAAFLESSAKENQTAVDVFRRIILEAEKIDGAASQGKSSCSVM